MTRPAPARPLDASARRPSAKAGHRALAGYLDGAQHAVAALPGDPATRPAAVHAVEDVTRHLVAPLDEEERQLGPALKAVSRVVPEQEVPAPPPEHLHGVPTWPP
jgi:hypothetical protein